MRLCFEQNAHQHGMYRNRLARACGAGNQQMRHALKVNQHRRPRDILAQSKRQRRGGFVVVPGIEYSIKKHCFACFIGYFKADCGLAGNHLHHPHTGYRQSACQIFLQVGDAAGFGAGGGVQFKACDDRPRLDTDHLGVDPKIGEFDLQLLDHCFHGFLRQPLGLFVGRVKLIQRRQCAVGTGVGE